MNRVTAKLFLMAHHCPVRIGTNDALTFYRTVARIHGYRLERRLNGWVFA